MLDLSFKYCNLSMCSLSGFCREQFRLWPIRIGAQKNSKSSSTRTRLGFVGGLEKLVNSSGFLSLIAKRAAYSGSPSGSESKNIRGTGVLRTPQNNCARQVSL